MTVLAAITGGTAITPPLTQAIPALQSTSPAGPILWALPWLLPWADLAPPTCQARPDR